MRTIKNTHDKIIAARWNKKILRWNGSRRKGKLDIEGLDKISKYEEFVREFAIKYEVI